MNKFNPLNLLKNWRYGLKPGFTIVCAALMLGGYFLLSPWVSIDLSGLPFPTGGAGGAGFQLPEGFEIPEGFQIPGAAASEGGQADAASSLPEGFQPPAGFQLPESTPAAGAGDSAAGGFQLPEGFQIPDGAQAGGFPAFPEVDQGDGRFLIPAAALLALIMAIGSLFYPRYAGWASGLTFVAGLISLVYYGIYVVNDTVSTTAAFIPQSLSIGFWVALVGCIGLVVQIIIPRPSEDDEGEGDVAVIVQGRTSGLSLAQNLSVAFDAMLANKLRSGLTMLGIIIGVASVVSLLAVGQGAQSAVTDQLEGTGLNLLTVSSGGGFGPGGGGANTQTLTYDDARAISEEVEGLTAVLPQYSGNLEVRSDQSNYTASVLGVSANYAIVQNIAVEIGTYFNGTQYETNARVAVLGKSAAEELFGGLNPIGRDIRIDGTRFEVIGVLEEQDSGFGSDPNTEIQVPLTTAYRNLFNARATASNDNLVSSITVAVENVDDVTVVTSDIETLLRDRHRLDEGEDNDFNVLDQQQLLSAASTITGILTLLLGAIASISLVVGGIGIMNITLVSVTERTREIGLRKAIGARRAHILQQFLIETIFLSVLGGIIGVLTGVAIATLVNVSGLVNASVTMDSILLGLGFSLVVGVFFGVYPANQAASLQPIEALRSE